MCEFIKADGTKCGNKGRCPYHDKHLRKSPIHLTKKDSVRKSPSFVRSAAASAVGNLVARSATAIFVIVLALVFPNSFRILQTLNSPLPPSNPVRTVV